MRENLGEITLSFDPKNRSYKMLLLNDHGLQVKFNRAGDKVVDFNAPE